MKDKPKEAAYMSNYFAQNGLALDGISHYVVNGRLVIKIDSTKHTIEFHTDSLDVTSFNIHNDCFWVQKKIPCGDTTKYEVSNIVQHGPRTKVDESRSQKVSDLFIDVSETDYIIVIVN